VFTKRKSTVRHLRDGRSARTRNTA
jgi:hypothetical protein